MIFQESVEYTHCMSVIYLFTMCLDGSPGRYGTETEDVHNSAIMTGKFTTITY